MHSGVFPGDLDPIAQVLAQRLDQGAIDIRPPCNRLLAVGVGKRTAEGMETEVFAVR